jgi:hypothetical protein
MLPEEEWSMSENEEPKKTEQASEPDAPMTQEQFSAQWAQLTERAKAAGLRPIQVLIRSYAQQGMTMLDKVLEGLEPVDSKKKQD